MIINPVRKILVGKIIIIGIVMIALAIAIWGLYSRELDYLHIVSFTGVGFTLGFTYSSLTK